MRLGALALGNKQTSLQQLQLLERVHVRAPHASQCAFGFLKPTG
jgi:hypothetical protein